MGKSKKEKEEEIAAKASEEAPPADETSAEEAPKDKKKSGGTVEITQDAAGYKCGDLIEVTDENSDLCARLVDRGKAKKSTKKK